MKLTWDEWHAFIIGFGHAIWVWKKLPMPMAYKNPLDKEYHYYIAGGTTAIFIIIGIIIYIGRLIWQ